MRQLPLIELPNEVRTLQEWFASIIGRPLTESDGIDPISPSGKPIIDEAPLFIAKSCSFPAHKRLEIYNQQFWYRLFNFMEVTYPLTRRLLGYQNFKKITAEYLVQFPPKDWSLTSLGNDFHSWIKDKNQDRLIENAIEADATCYASSIAAKYSSLKPEDFLQKSQNTLLNKEFFLQPHLSLKQFPYDLFGYREEIIKEDLDFWLKNKPPTLMEITTQYFVVFRTSKNRIAWQNITKEESELLQLFINGCTILKACEYIEKQDYQTKRSISENFLKYFKDWILLDWITLNH